MDFIWMWRVSSGLYINGGGVVVDFIWMGRGRIVIYMDEANSGFYMDEG